MTMDPIDQLIRRLNLRDLRIFLTVIEKGNLAQAAASLAVSRPVVSKSLAALEHALGVRLLDRTPQRVIPTEFGRVLIKRGISLFDELRQGVRELKYLADPSQGELRIGASEYMAAGLIPRIIDQLSIRHSDLTFKIELGDEIERLRKRQVEFVVMRLLSPNLDVDLEAEALFYERIFIAAGPTNKFAGRRKILLSDLASEPWILAPAEIVEGSPIVEAFQAIGQLLPKTTVLGLSLPLRNGLLATGRFLTIVPGSVMKFGAERTLLRILPVSLPSWHLPVAIVTVKNRTLTPLAKLFIERVRAAAKPLAASRPARA
jgi:DNA-binding transcriptional LysR family regulator